MPYSPRWLVSQDRDEEARQFLRQLRLTRQSAGAVQSTTTLAEIKGEEERNALEVELQEIKSAVHAYTKTVHGRAASYAELFHKKYRFPVLLGIVFMAFQQLIGINVVF